MQEFLSFQSVNKPDVIEVVRYFRDWDHDHDQIASNGGMTAICQLNYRNMSLTFYPSFCMKSDNFSKREGLMAAKRNKERGAGFVCRLRPGSTIFYNILHAIKFNEIAATNDYAKKNLTKHLTNWYVKQ